jgi:hypothetical protein
VQNGTTVFPDKSAEVRNSFTAGVNVADQLGVPTNTVSTPVRSGAGPVPSSSSVPPVSAEIISASFFVFPDWVKYAIKIFAFIGYLLFYVLYYTV